MTSALVLYYSQSGETIRVAKLFADELAAAGAVVELVGIQPKTAYPYPWKSIIRFFDAMPDAVLGMPIEISPLLIDPSTRFDLVVLAYPVWFLSPATPIQAFFRSRYAGVLSETDVLTISVSRAMWQRASVAMVGLLAKAGARHCDNVAVTHQGSPLTTLISTPRALLFGKSDRLLGVFPSAGVAGEDLTRVKRLASVAARRLIAGRAPGAPLLSGEDAVSVKRWLAVPELLAWYCFYGSAVTIRALGKVHRGLRVAGVLAFAIFLVILIVLGLPMAVLATFLATPFINSRLNAYIARLAGPTGQVKPIFDTAQKGRAISG
ncbi:MAG: hypothetical protein ABI399_05870 [Bauldia sp.]